MVVAITALLAIIIFTLLSPTQQLAKSRDVGRIRAVQEVGRIMEAFALGRGSYVPESPTTGCDPLNWMGCLVAAGELSSVPDVINYNVNGTEVCEADDASLDQHIRGVEINGICYNSENNLGSMPMVIYARMEANANISLCTPGQWAYFTYSSADGRGGIICRDSGLVPLPGVQNPTFVN